MEAAKEVHATILAHDNIEKQQALNSLECVLEEACSFFRAFSTRFAPLVRLHIWNSSVQCTVIIAKHQLHVLQAMLLTVVFQLCTINVNSSTRMASFLFCKQGLASKGSRQ
jgi:hypothetical protein